MIGIHSLPLITNCFLNGIRQFDTRLALEAMVASASKDTCGWSMGYFVGLKNYKKYGYGYGDYYGYGEKESRKEKKRS